MRKIALLLAIFGLCGAMSGWANTIDTTGLLDPTTLHIGSGQGTTCQTGGCPIFGTEVNAISGTFDIFQESANSGLLQDPVLLILAVPNDTKSGTLNGTEVQSVTNFDPYTALSGTPVSFETGVDGLNPPASSAFFQGLMTNSDIYTFLGLKADKSNSFLNLSAADLALNGITATNFGIYIWSIDISTAEGMDFDGNDLLNIVSSGIPKGTFAVAYGFDSQHTFAVPFTEAGLTGPPSRVPEPATLALLGTGLLGIAGAIRRRMKK